MAKKRKNTFDDLRIIMINALLEMHSLVETDAATKADFIPRDSLFLTGLMSTAADLSEVVVPGSSAYLYAEIESAAKNGGLRSIAQTQEKGGNSYSVSI